MLRMVALAASCLSACGSGTDSVERDRDAAGAIADAAVAADALPFVHETSARSAPPGDDTQLRIVSWNIKAARQAPLEAIGQRLLELQPDVSVLQEVDLNVDRTGGVDQPAILAEMLAAEYVFAAAIPYDNGHFGLATLSRYPLTRVERIALGNEDAGEARTALDTSFCAGAVCVRLVNHHADLVPAAGERSVLEILDAVRADIGGGVIVAGDFNQTPAELGPRSYVQAGFTDLLAATESASESSSRIDYIFADDALAGCVVHAEIVRLGESDHDALLADFDLSQCTR